jgi:hypothetical protein
VKKIIILGFIAALGVFLLQQALRKPAEDEFLSPDSSTRNESTNPVHTVQTTVPGKEPVQPDNSRISTDDLLGQLKAAVSTYDPAKNANFLKLLAELVRRDPAAAGRFAESLPSGSGSLRNDVLLHVAQGWAAQDPAGAEAWAAKLPDKNENQTVLSDVCFKVSEVNVAQSVQMAVKDNLNTMPGVLENLVTQWARQDFPSALAWSKNQPAGEQRDQMFERLAVIQSKTAPAEAAKLVAEEIAPGPVQDDAVVSVITRWGTSDMAGATVWVNQFPSGPLKERAKEVLSNMTASNQSHQKNGQ